MHHLYLKIKSSQQVVQGLNGSTILRINAEKLQVTGSEETLGIEI